MEKIQVLSQQNQNMEYKISVIVPVYNVEHYIERCVRSLFEQTMTEGVEYIFVNDCTPDRSMQVLEEVASEYPDRLEHIRYIHHSLNSGASAARNSGLALAQGEYIYYADSDDWVEKDMLADMYKAAKETDADIVRSDFFCTYSTHEVYVKQGDETDPMACVKLLLSEKLHGAFWTKLVRRTLYTDHKIIIISGYWEDLRASVQLFYYAKKITCIPKAYYHYVQHSSVISLQNYKKRLKEIIRNTDGIIEFLKDKNVELDKQIHYLKLAAKKTLLFTCYKSFFRQWLRIYPESNKYIWSYPSLPLHLRIVGGCTALRLWPLIDLWIQAKKWYRGKTETPVERSINNAMPNISVIVTVYKAEKYIERCAKSLFEQTFDSVEYIFVNDCTPDRSMQVLKEVASNYPDRLEHIRYVDHSLNSGVSAARNTGLAMAKGEYIFYADADDWMEREMLADMFKAARENDADIVRCDYIYAYAAFEKRVKQSNTIDPMECIKLLLSEKEHGALWTKLVRRTLYTDNTIVFYDGNRGDLRASVQLFYYAKKITYIPKAYYHYVQYNPHALSVKNLEKRLNEMIRQAEGIIAFLNGKDVQLDRHIHYLKLATKQNLLFTCDKSSFRKWLTIYPESNNYIWIYPSLPFHLRIVGGCTAMRLWPLIWLWIQIKKCFRRVTRTHNK